MVIKATLGGLRISQVPITLYKDGRSRPPHLRSWRDGWRHLRFMLLFSPRWLFLVPGLALMFAGLAGTAAVMVRASQPLVGGGFDVGTLAVMWTLFIVGFQLVMFGVFAKTYAITQGFMPADARFGRWLAFFSLERSVLLGTGLVLAGFIGLCTALFHWQQSGFGDLDYATNLRRIVPSTTAIIFGVQVIFSSFFLSVLQLPVARRQP